MSVTYQWNSLKSAIVLIVALVGSLAPTALKAAAPSAARPPAFPLKVSQNHRYLVDENGTPFLIVGDSPQEIMSRLTEKEAEFYFADREAHGFNTLGWIDAACAGQDNPTNPLAATPDGIRPFTAFLSGGNDYRYYDLSKPNEAYFVRLDHMVQMAMNHHLAVFIDPIETILWLPTLRNNGVKGAYEYGQFLGRRYVGFKNVMWVNGNDFGTWHAGEKGALLQAAKQGVGPFVRTWRERNDDLLVQAVARGIRSQAPQQLQTIELQPPTSSSFDDSVWIPLIELNGTYSYAPTYIQMLKSYNQRPAAPVFLMEAHYEFEDIGDPHDLGTPYVERKQAYWAMLSGGTGQFHGSRYSELFPNGWQNNIDTSSVQQIGYWKSLFLSLPWQNLIPDQDHSIVRSGMGSYGSLQTPVSTNDYAIAAKTADGSTVVIYIPALRPISVNMAVLSRAAYAEWFDPSSGTYRDVPGRAMANVGTREFTPPGKNRAGDGDWVLLIRTSIKEHPGRPK